MYISSYRIMQVIDSEGYYPLSIKIKVTVIPSSKNPQAIPILKNLLILLEAFFLFF